MTLLSVDTGGPGDPTIHPRVHPGDAQRYTSASRTFKSRLLTEFCATTGYHRKAAIRVLRQPPRPSSGRRPRGRPSPYTPQVIKILLKIWKAAGYPWSVRLKALLPLWLPWTKQHFPLAAMNDLYRHELRLMMNLFQPSVKLQRKTRVGSRLRRVYDQPQTPLDRLLAAEGADRPALVALQRLRRRLDPFALADTIERKLQDIYQLAHRGPIRGAPHPHPHQHFHIHHPAIAINRTAAGAAR